MGEMDQEDIDKLLADALGSDSDSAPMGQNDIDALLAEASNTSDDAPMEQDGIDALLNEANAEAESTPMGQDDIDALLNEANAEDEDTPMGQDDIDAMLNAANAEDEDTPMGQDDIDAMLNAANTEDEDTPMGQDDIDAMLNAANEEDESAPMGQDDIDAMLNAANEEDEDTPMGQDDIDAMLNAANEEDEDTPMGQDDIDAMLNAANEEDEDTPMGQDDIDAMLNATNEEDIEQEGIEDESLLDQDSIDNMLDEANNNVMAQNDIDTLLADNSISDSTPEEIKASDDAAEDSGAMEQNDIDALLADAIKDSADSAINEATNISNTDDNSDFNISEGENEDIDSSYSDDIQESIVSQEIPQTDYSSPPPIAEHKSAFTTAAPKLTKQQMQNIQESLSLSKSSGEVENLAGQMSGLLGQLSERARRFQAAWLTADQETQELRHAITLTQQKVHVLSGEKQSLQAEIHTLRKQYSQIEGEKLASSEAHRTEIASLELQLREQESRNNMISSEIRSLKEELERARNETTGSDLESRRSRFELERITSELTAEKQERQRLARALENREKELQAMQAQSAGHASTLFLDELHRLVRRLESELDIRTSSANEALSVIDRMEFFPEQEMYASTLRSSVAAAAGLTPDENDALTILDKQASTGQQSLEPAPPPGSDSFKSALERYDFAKASAIASASMRSGEKTPLDFVKVIHDAAILRRPEISKYLDDLSAMLRGIKNLQEASDRARGKEGENTEILCVLIFDLLHTFVRMKLISRATTSIWNLFLELRGRFSFLTSDRQWNEYRDRLLSGSKVMHN